MIERFYLTIDRTMTGIATYVYCRPDSCGNVRILHILQTPNLEPCKKMKFNAIARVIHVFTYCNSTLIMLVYIINSFIHY